MPKTIIILLLRNQDFKWKVDAGRWRTIEMRKVSKQEKGNANNIYIPKRIDFMSACYIFSYLACTHRVISIFAIHSISNVHGSQLCLRISRKTVILTTKYALRCLNIRAGFKWIFLQIYTFANNLSYHLIYMYSSIDLPNLEWWTKIG